MAVAPPHCVILTDRASQSTLFLSNPRRMAKLASFPSQKIGSRSKQEIVGASLVQLRLDLGVWVNSVRVHILAGDGSIRTDHSVYHLVFIEGHQLR